MQKDPTTVFVDYEYERPLLKAYEEWMEGLGEKGFLYPPKGPGKLVGNKMVGVSFAQVSRNFLNFLDIKKIRYEEIHPF